MLFPSSSAVIKISFLLVILFSAYSEAVKPSILEIQLAKARWQQGNCVERSKKHHQIKSSDKDNVKKSDCAKKAIINEMQQSLTPFIPTTTRQ